MYGPEPCRFVAGEAGPMVLSVLRILGAKDLVTSGDEISLTTRLGILELRHTWSVRQLRHADIRQDRHCRQRHASHRIGTIHRA